MARAQTRERALVANCLHGLILVSFAVNRKGNFAIIITLLAALHNDRLSRRVRLLVEFGAHPRRRLRQVRRAVEVAATIETTFLRHSTGGKTEIRIKKL